MSATRSSPSMDAVTHAAVAICQGEVGAGDVLFAALKSEDKYARKAGYAAMRATMEIAARASASPVLPLLEAGSLDDGAVTLVRNWWYGSRSSPTELAKERIYRELSRFEIFQVLLPV